MLCNYIYIGFVTQGVVPIAITRSAKSNVLSVRVRKQEQLQPSNQSGVTRQSRSLALFQIYWPIHCHGKRPLLSNLSVQYI